MLAVGCIFSLSLLLIVEISQAKNFTNLVSLLLSLALLSSYAAAALSLEFLSAGIILSFASAVLVVVTLFMSSGYSMLNNNSAISESLKLKPSVMFTLLSILCLIWLHITNNLSYSGDKFVLSTSGFVNWSGVAYLGSYSFTILIHTVLSTLYLFEGLVINIILIVAFTTVGVLLSHSKTSKYDLTNTAASKSTLRP